ncbi:hypothetical protein CANCADRAFT_29619 [Tortispora caseinolytica NRRL Y-17796]|uniref:DNA ligase n=1 Tax=Tortispora caseinolytica NRRL Y-17796 TaxID=767744 RepID=A0A1E4T9H7_9ASCO|nr:hypothetical protein CANCADRAFT_29619 [Tortispora caseinolytica NRRL Y-17796]
MPSSSSAPSANSSIPYADVCAVFEQIEGTTKRLEIISYCSEFFRQILDRSPHSLSTVVYLFINRLGPDYEGLELGLGDSILMKAVCESTGKTLANLKKDMQETGDLGTIANAAKSSQRTMFKPQMLTVDGVFKDLHTIAQTTGAQSQSRKIGLIKKLIVNSRNNETKFLIRSLQGKLRISLAEKSVLTALARAFAMHEADIEGKSVSEEKLKEADVIFKSVFSRVPSYETIIEAALKYGVKGLTEHCVLVPGIPPKPMLAKPTKSITEVLDHFSDLDNHFTCEYKYDGERAQIHMTEDGSFKVYSRNSEDMSQRYPDILSSINKFITPSVKSFIIDSEAVAWDRQKHTILPFQVLSTRKRKDVQESDISVRVFVFVFDILYLNGQDLLSKSLTERRAILQEHFSPVEDCYGFATFENCREVEAIQDFLDQSIKDNCEGLMIKALDGPESHYLPSKRTQNWLKLKKDYLDGIGDTLDLVVLGAFYGKGKRTNWYGAFLLGCYNPNTGEYETTCKIGTGFSEEVLEQLYKELSPLVTSKKSYYKHDQSGPSQPDVWFEPKMVWEVLAADLSLSPIYKAGADSMPKGISLRFPRFIRIRDDKATEDATTSDQIIEFYKRQASVAGQSKADDSDYD